MLSKKQSHLQKMETALIFHLKIKTGRFIHSFIYHPIKLHVVCFYWLFVCCERCPLNILVESKKTELLMIPRLNWFFCLLRTNNMHHFACGQNTTILRIFFFPLSTNFSKTSKRKAYFCVSVSLWVSFQKDWLFTVSD